LDLRTFGSVVPSLGSARRAGVEAPASLLDDNLTYC
jgi:hypothetical protein